MDGIRALMDGGSHGNLATLEPQLSPMLWTSIATGKMAYHHGVEGFTEVDPVSGGGVPVSAATRRRRDPPGKPVEPSARLSLLWQNRAGPAAVRALLCRLPRAQRLRPGAGPHPVGPRPGRRGRGNPGHLLGIFWQLDLGAHPPRADLHQKRAAPAGFRARRKSARPGPAGGSGVRTFLPRLRATGALGGGPGHRRVPPRHRPQQRAGLCHPRARPPAAAPAGAGRGKRPGGDRFAIC